jgi:hypothetical protein
MSLVQLLARPGQRRLIEVVTKLPNLGVGARVARRSWAPYGDSWWEVTDVKLKGDDAAAGRVWGVLHWRGQRAEGPPRRIGGAFKRVWVWLPDGQTQAALAPLAAQVREQERAARAAARATASGE